MPTLTIREIQKTDNAAVARCIRDVFEELGIPKIGTAYEDKALDRMFETYENPRSTYFVVEENKKIIGSAGIAQLAGAKETVCELQKMYFLIEARGRGIGSQMIVKCLDMAKVLKYKTCYIETMPFMEAARTLYRKNGFEIIDKPLGNTGHYSCTVFMIKRL